jgi:DNA-binding CsgD family transcriptional regulator/uncharacterized protein YegP (UPF0339 family)
MLLSDSKGINSRLQKLSPRELAVLKLIALGTSSKDIAAKIGISIRTVDFHRANLIRKTNLHSVADLTRLALSADLLKEPDDANQYFSEELHPQQLQITGWFEIFSDEHERHWEWRLFAGAGDLLLTGVSSIPRKDLRTTLSEVRASSLLGELYRRHVRPHSAPFFRLHNLNGSILANSPKFPSVNAMELGLQMCKESAPTAILVEKALHNLSPGPRS